MYLTYAPLEATALDDVLAGAKVENVWYVEPVGNRYTGHLILYLKAGDRHYQLSFNSTDVDLYTPTMKEVETPRGTEKANLTYRIIRPRYGDHTKEPSYFWQLRRNWQYDNSPEIIDIENGSYCCADDDEDDETDE